MGIIYDIIYYAIFVLPIILISIILHEMGHGYVSYWLGDPTPKSDGRLSLNPMKHVDPIGALCLLLFHFGWARPVMINPEYYRKPKLGIALVSIAGPIMNLILAFIGGLLFVITFKYVGSDSEIGSMLINASLILTQINIGLFIFNLIPIPPLDGSKILGSFLKGDAYYQYMKYQRYGAFFLFGLILLLDLAEMYTGVDILGQFMIYVEKIVFNICGRPFDIKFIFDGGYIYGMSL